ncbi:MAG TPA: DUF1761 domain-containing protein [Candidatus Nanoarchaeia archaeon]|nr:DUF1761 domain-containing protein [Candidatus Nanoarchaeia archaeon]
MFWDIITATLASIVLGFSWYGPWFGKKWMKYMKITQKQMKAAQKKGMPASSYFWMILSALIPAIVFSVFAPETALAAIGKALLIWIGFFVPVQIGSVNWEGRPWGFFFLNVGYHLVNLVIMALIFAGFN